MDPWRETTSSQKNGWAANRATHGARSVILPFTSRSRGARRALISNILNYVFTCVVARASELAAVECPRRQHAYIWRCSIISPLDVSLASRFGGTE